MPRCAFKKKRWYKMKKTVVTNLTSLSTKTNKKHPKEFMVVKNHELLPQLARFNLQELRLVNFCVSKIDPTKDWKKCVNGYSRTICAPLQEFMEAFGLRCRRKAAKLVAKTCASLNSKPLTMKRSDRDDHIYWFERLTYKKDDRIMEFVFPFEVVRYLVDLRGKFNKYRLSEIYSFRRPGTWRLFEYLRANEYRGEWSVTVNELKDLIGLTGKYKEWRDFRRQMLTPAVDEINENTDTDVELSTKRSNPGNPKLLTFRFRNRASGVSEGAVVLNRALQGVGIIAATREKIVQRAIKLNYTVAIAEFVGILRSQWNKTDRSISIQKHVTGAVKKRLDESEGASRGLVPVCRLAGLAGAVGQSIDDL